MEELEINTYIFISMAEQPYCANNDQFFDTAKTKHIIWVKSRGVRDHGISRSRGEYFFLLHQDLIKIKTKNGYVKDSVTFYINAISI